MEGFRFLVEGPAPRLTPSLRLRNVIVPRERVKDTSQTCYFFKTIEKAEREKIYELVAEGLMCLRLWQSEPERQTCRLIDPATVYSLPYTCTQAHREAMPYFKTIHELTICLRHNIKPRLTILPTPTLSTIRRLVVYRLPGFPLDLKALRNLDTVILGFQDIPTPVVMLPTLGFPTAQPYTDDNIAARAWTVVWNYARGKGNSPIFHPNSTPSGYIIKAVQLAVSPLKARYYLYDMDEYWGSNYHTIDVWGKTDEELVKNAMKLMRKHWAKYLGLMGRYY